MTTKVLALHYNKQHIIRALSISLGVCAILYGILVCTTIFNTVDRKNFEQNIQALHSQLGQLESQYIAHGKTIDLSYAHSLGFEDTPQVKFATRSTLVGVSVALHNEI